MKIVTDTSSLFRPDQQEELGLTVLPVCININQKSYKEYIEIDTSEVLRMVKQGFIPKTSQPAIGEVMQIFEECTEDLIFLPAADGISGAYQNAMSAKMNMKNHEKIHIIDTKNVLGPHHYLVEKALRMSKESFSLQEVLNSLQESIESSISFLIPSDFEFLKRGGRLTPLAATLGGMLKIVPVMTLSEDRKRIEKYAVKRTLKKALDDIIDKFKSVGVNHEYLITILQVDALEKATEIVNQFKQIFTNTRIDFMELSPAFIAQAGPGCIVIQAVKL